MKLIAVSETARRLQCSTTHVYKLIEHGLLQEYRSGRRHYVVEDSVTKHIHLYGIGCSIAMAQIIAANPELQSRAESEQQK